MPFFRQCHRDDYFVILHFQLSSLSNAYFVNVHLPTAWDGEDNFVSVVDHLTNVLLGQFGCRLERDFICLCGDANVQLCADARAQDECAL